jgi:hypothetical protein
MSFPDIETSLRSGLGKPMTDIVLKLSAVLERLPVAIGLVSSTGHFVGKAGGMAGILGRMDPSHDAREATRWSFNDRRGAAIPRSEWPSARALRGERHYDGMIGRLHDGDERPIKVISLPVHSPGSRVAAFVFVQVLENRTPSSDGSHYDLQHRLIDELAKSLAGGWSAPETANVRRRA